MPWMTSCCSLKASFHLFRETLPLCVIGVAHPMRASGKYHRDSLARFICRGHLRSKGEPGFENPNPGMCAASLAGARCSCSRAALHQDIRVTRARVELSVHSRPVITVQHVTVRGFASSYLMMLKTGPFLASLAASAPFAQSPAARRLPEDSILVSRRALTLSFPVDSGHSGGERQRAAARSWARARTQHALAVVVDQAARRRRAGVRDIPVSPRRDGLPSID